MRRDINGSLQAAIAAVIVAALWVTVAARAEDAATPSTSAAPAAAEPYRPGLGEIMSLQQMRHIKLWFAGNAGNWPLADYELGELQEGFGDVTDLLGGDVVDRHVGPPIAALQKAIDAKDRAGFMSAFDRLSAGCSACHRTLDHGFIVIGRPTSLPYSDQNFAPQK